MYVTIVQIHVKPDHVADFAEAMRANREGSIREPGNVRFDVLHSADDPTRFVTIMAYQDKASADAHRETAHYLAWRDQVADWMAEPRRVVPYDGLFPSGQAASAEGSPAGSGGRRGGQTGGATHVTLVYVHVEPERVADFVEAIRVNHEGSIREPGNLRFDILQSADDPTRFVAYEAYRDEVSAKAHKETAHYLVWRDLVADWMVEPRQGVRYDGLFPEVG